MNFITILTTFATLLTFFISSPLVQALPSPGPAMLMGQHYGRWQPGAAVGYKGPTPRDELLTREERFHARQFMQDIVRKADTVASSRVESTNANSTEAVAGKVASNSTTEPVESNQRGSFTGRTRMLGRK
ncbi:hypothetical protein BDN72DRAFT_843772 [Pluteus cervinus]|uniref:Uncharacterized protein n=1 Tax=Pluteus cervinus TaxID=181527 RepID=A0ACD3ALG3_9AGAR|nr:hypothetical protein BDN72DRAFT_843772 [Pluteus cervinus]